MQFQVSSQPTTAANVVQPAHLHGWRLLLAGTTWIGCTVLALVAFFVSIPASLAQYEQVCSGQCSFGDLTPALVTEINHLGLSLATFAWIFLTIELVVVAVWVGLGLIIGWRRFTDPSALFVATFLTTFGVTLHLSSLGAAGLGAAWPLVRTVVTIGWTTFLLFGFLFPTARCVPRWTRWPVALIVVLAALTLVLPDNPRVQAISPVGQPTLLCLLLTGIVAQVYRYRCQADDTQRQQTRWVLAGIVAAITIVVGMRWVVVLINPAGLAATLVASLTVVFATFLLPVAISVAITRNRLWNINALFSQTLSYAMLSVIVAAVYAALVGGLGALFQNSGSPFIALLATGLVAVLFQPLRTWLQRGANRLIFGVRTDPYAALLGLSQRLETSLSPDETLDTIVATVAQTLHLPYVAIVLDQLARNTADLPALAVATYGAPPTTAAELHVLPLRYQRTEVGQLIVGPPPGHDLSMDDRQRLADLAHHAGAAVQAARLAAHLRQLTVDLQQSRERLVLGQEEERRRLRRDLHDGLGPTLAVLALQADAVAEQIPANPGAAVTLADQLRGDIRAAVSEVRRLVYDLRPPALDELGLIAAIRDLAAQIARRSVPAGLQIMVTAPSTLPHLPAAVEVVVYRVVQEALTNVVKHAHAHHCIVDLRLSAGLELTVQDDGIGLPTTYRAGIGLIAMRERAEELGGQCEVTHSPTGGSVVTLQLPLVKE